MLRRIFYRLPPAARFLLRRLWYLPSDVLTKRLEMTPPRGLIYTGRGDFVKQGEEWLAFFISQGLRPEQHFLDIGSGIGRIARALTSYLNGRYEGFDVVKMGVSWCEKNISSRFPHFRFQYVELYNDLYRFSGDSAENFQFPYESDMFDFACAISVFTHLLPTETENYLKQVSQVLKKEGRLVATFFILPEASDFKKLKFHFPFNFGHYALMDKSVKHGNVAYNADYLFQLFTQNNFRLIQWLKGSWKGTETLSCSLAFQDVVVLERG